MKQDRLSRKFKQHRGQGGQNLVEFALMLPVLVIILLGVLDLGRSFYTYISLTNAAREAAREAALTGSTSSAQVTREYTALDGANLSGCVNGSLTFTGSEQSFADGTKIYTARVSCRFQLVTPLMGQVVGAGANNRITIGSNATFAKEK
ncbi:MAG TPA: TadE family protein [Herpetosiphonaceae bacterium]|nr:TadE family protein [Herpetosiphonaceae bacterium]